jgi:hypothetical protein
MTLGKMSMPMSFGYVNNTRTEDIMFDIVEMSYPHNAILGRGMLNAFEVVVHSCYLCMKMTWVHRRYFCL